MAVLDFENRFGIPRSAVQFQSVLRAAPDTASGGSVTAFRTGGVGAPTTDVPRSVLFCASTARPIGDELRRLQRFARALGVRPQVLLRGTGATARAARAMGWTVVDATPRAILDLQPELAVVDETSPALVRMWMRLARLFELPVATMRDLSARLRLATEEVIGIGSGWIPADAAGGDADADVPGQTFLAIGDGGPWQTMGSKFGAFMTPSAGVDNAAGLVA